MSTTPQQVEEGLAKVLGRSEGPVIYRAYVEKEANANFGTASGPPGVASQVHNTLPYAIEVTIKKAEAP